MADLTLVPPALPPPHPEVDMALEDPCLVDGRRLCVAATKAGPRCSAPALRSDWYCSAHAGRLDASAGGQAKAAKLEQEKLEAHELAVEARLGTRAIVARVFQDRHEDLRGILNEMLDDCRDPELPAKERRAMRLALIPWVNQGLGMPKEQVEVTLPGTVEEIEEMSLEDLRLAARVLGSSATR